MISDFIYNIFVGPIQYVVEIIFSIFFRLFHSKIIAILGVSVVINLLVLPLYNKSDAIQEKERLKQKDMEHWVKHIRKTFRGDKRYMMLTTYYRQQNYKPIYALRGSLSLLLQIPFFIAAYNFLSADMLLTGTSFWIIKDLGAQDQLIRIGSVGINVLPILMTVVNLISGTIYTKGFAKKERIQLYLTALVFLALLYTSPSGLVIYWLLNNCFSLVKNIVVNLRKQHKKPAKASSEVPRAKRIQKGQSSLGFLNLEKKEKSLVLVLLSCLSLSVLMGLLIPFDIIKLSPIEFYYSSYTWKTIVLNTFSTYLGFSFWLLLIYYMVDDKVKYYLSVGMTIIALVATPNYDIFHGYDSSLSDNLVYSIAPNDPVRSQLKNFFVILLISLFVYIVYHWKQFAVKLLLVGIILAASVNSVMTYNRIIKKSGVNAIKSTDTQIDSRIIPLSTEGQNVVVIMLDRAVGYWLPTIVENEPEVREVLDGFTFYPNTVSLGKHTNSAAPALFGGYEYSIYEMNKRPNESLSQKHDEALSVMPVIFNDHDYTVTVCDPPYVGSYNWVPDVSIYDQYENITGYVTTGNVINDTHNTFSPYFKMEQMHNYVSFGFFASSPLFIKPLLYDNGDYYGYWNAIPTCSFLDSYAVLEELSNLTDIQEGNENTFLMFQNSTTHEPVVLDGEHYTPTFDSTPATKAEGAYDVYVASLLRLGEWFKYMKENDAFDNTKIILTSDHGWLYYPSQYPTLDRGALDYYNPLLLVKDFQSSGDLKVDDTFMTNADVPTIAFSGVIDDPVNPFTGKPINSSVKEDGKVIVVHSSNYNTNTNNGNLFDYSDGCYYWVHDSLTGTWSEYTEDEE